MPARSDDSAHLENSTVETIGVSYACLHTRRRIPHALNVETLWARPWLRPELSGLNPCSRGAQLRRTRIVGHGQPFDRVGRRDRDPSLVPRDETPLGVRRHRSRPAGA